jgi:hypothetical protein
VFYREQTVDIHCKGTITFVVSHSCFESGWCGCGMPSLALSPPLAACSRRLDLDHVTLARGQGSIAATAPLHTHVDGTGKYFPDFPIFTSTTSLSQCRPLARRPRHCWVATTPRTRRRRVKVSHLLVDHVGERYRHQSLHHYIDEETQA